MPEGIVVSEMYLNPDETRMLHAIVNAAHECAVEICRVEPTEGAVHNEQILAGLCRKLFSSSEEAKRKAATQQERDEKPPVPSLIRHNGIPTD